jgi:hypothetical protein
LRPGEQYPPGGDKGGDLPERNEPVPLTSTPRQGPSLYEKEAEGGSSTSARPAKKLRAESNWNNNDILYRPSTADLLIVNDRFFPSLGVHEIKNAESVCGVCNPHDRVAHPSRYDVLKDEQHDRVGILQNIRGRATRSCWYR